MFIDRSRERGTHFLEWRVRLFMAGAVLAVVGMAMERQWIIWVAIGVLAVGFLLRFAPERKGEGEAGEPEPEGKDEVAEPEPDRHPERERAG